MLPPTFAHRRRADNLEAAHKPTIRSARPELVNPTRLTLDSDVRADASRCYFPRAVFFFGFGFLVLPVLPGAASFFGRFGDTGSLLPWLDVPRCPLVRIRSETPARPSSAPFSQIQIGQPSLPEHRAIGPQARDGDRERLPQTSKTGEGRAPMRSAQLEPGDGGIAAVPADDPPEARLGPARPLHPQLITRRPNDTQTIPSRARRTAPRKAGSAGMPATAGCPLTAHTNASDPSGGTRAVHLFDLPANRPDSARAEFVHPTAKISVEPANRGFLERAPSFGTHRSSMGEP